MKSFANLILLMCFAGSPAFAVAPRTELKTGRVHAIGDPSNTLFTEKTEVRRKGDNDFTTKSTIVDSEGRVVIRETATLANSLVVEQYTEQLQVDEAYEIKLKDEKLYFRTYNIKGGERRLSSSSEQDLPVNFITSPSLGHFLKINREKLDKGETLYAEFGSIELEKTVGFTFKKVSQDNDSVKLQMKLSNFIFQMMVDPMDIELDLKTSEMIRYQGKTPFRHGPEKQGLDGVVHYSRSNLVGGK